MFTVVLAHCLARGWAEFTVVFARCLARGWAVFRRGSHPAEPQEFENPLDADDGAEDIEAQLGTGGQKFANPLHEVEEAEEAEDVDAPEDTRADNDMVKSGDVVRPMAWRWRKQSDPRC